MGFLRRRNTSGFLALNTESGKTLKIMSKTKHKSTLEQGFLFSPYRTEIYHRRDKSVHARGLGRLQAETEYLSRSSSSFAEFPSHSILSSTTSLAFSQNNSLPFGSWLCSSTTRVSATFQRPLSRPSSRALLRKYCAASLIVGGWTPSLLKRWDGAQNLEQALSSFNAISMSWSSKRLASFWTFSKEGRGLFPIGSGFRDRRK
jgi:hypothetical protein